MADELTLEQQEQYKKLLSGTEQSGTIEGHAFTRNDDGSISISWSEDGHIHTSTIRNSNGKLNYSYSHTDDTRTTTIAQIYDENNNLESDDKLFTMNNGEHTRATSKYKNKIKISDDMDIAEGTHTQVYHSEYNAEERVILSKSKFTSQSADYDMTSISNGFTRDDGIRVSTNNTNNVGRKPGIPSYSSSTTTFTADNGKLLFKKFNEGHPNYKTLNVTTFDAASDQYTEISDTRWTDGRSFHSEVVLDSKREPVSGFRDTVSADGTKIHEEVIDGKWVNTSAPKEPVEKPQLGHFQENKLDVVARAAPEPLVAYAPAVKFVPGA